MGKQGFKDFAGNPYIYQESTISSAIGLDDGTNTFKIEVEPAAGATPLASQLTIDPAINGNVTITPNGIGNLIVSTGIIASNGNITAASANIVASFGDIQADSGDLILPLGNINLGASIGSNGSLIIGANGGPARWAHLTSTGSTIAITEGANTLNLETGASVATTYTTDAGNASPALGVLTVTGGNNIGTTGAGSTVTINLDGTTDHTVQIGNATGSLTSLAAATDGQIIIGSTGLDPVVGDLTSTDGSLTVTGGAGTLNIDTPDVLRTDTGFGTWGGAGDYFDDTTLGDFTILRPGTGYIKGIAVSWTAPQTVSGLTAGNTYIIYIDNTGTIGKTTNFSEAIFTENIPLFECLRDSTPITNNQITVKENHPYKFPVSVSFYAHEVIGCVIENNENGANITLNGTRGIQINGDDELSDHGLYTDIPDSAGVGVTFHMMYTDGAGKWATQNITDTFSGYWNNAGTATVLTATKFGVYTLYVSKDTITTTTPTYYAVLNTAEYNNLTAANTAISNGTISKISGELSSLELAQLGYIVYSQASNSIVNVIIAKGTLKQTISTAGSSTASLITTNTTNFDGILSVADTNVQSALETIDEFGKNLTDHAVVVGNGNGQPLGVIAVGATGETLMGVTGNDPAWTGSPSFSGSVTAGTTLTASNGDLTLTDGDVLIYNRDSATTSPILSFNKNRAGAALTSGDLVGTLKFSGYDGTQYTDGARITSTSSGTIASTRVASNLQFYTHPDSAAANPTLRMTIASTGATTIASPDAGTGLTVSGGGITCTSGAITASSGNVVITSGNLNLPNTTVTGAVGVINFNSTRFITNYGTNNTFVGQGSGSVTAGIGSFNTGVGFESLKVITTGTRNACLGDSTGITIADGHANTLFGTSTGSAVTSGVYNCYLGKSVGYVTTTGSYNVVIGPGSGSNSNGTGYGAGSSMSTSASSNIYITNDGASESNTIRIGTQGSGDKQQNKAYIAGIYNTAVGATAGVVLSDSSHQLGGLAGAAGQVLQGGTKPAFSTTTYPSTTAKGDILAASAANTITTIGAGTTGQVLQAVTSDKPAYSTATYPSTAAIGDVLVASAANTIGVVAGGSATTGYVLTATNGSAPSFQAPAGGGITWSEETGATVALAADKGYIMNRGTAITATLPGTCAIGKVIRIAGKGDGLTVIAQNANQMIHFGSSTTTTGVGGSLTATHKRDCVELLCVVADLEFEVLSSQGNWTIA